MGGKNGKLFLEFIDLCASALKVLQDHGKAVINMFALMVPAGMPELSNREEIRYLRDMIYQDDDIDGMRKTLQAEAERGLRNWIKKLDNFGHIMKHKK